jgi:glycosyltransferase involved in cell wall biosynthesis
LALPYVVVTPVRDEAGNLPRLAGSLLEQTVRPAAWVIVDTGSEDGTVELVRRLAREHDWIRFVASPQPRGRGGPIVRAFEAGRGACAASAQVIAKVDADVSVEPRYFEVLLGHFARDEQLGIASGICLEEHNGRWHPRFVTGPHVWGACRAYRGACLRDVAPLEQSMGWDGIDVLRAQARGWRTATFPDLPFRHHRGEGGREGRFAAWSARGRAAYYMHYRPAFLVLRALGHATKDPRAIGMIAGWAGAALRRQPRSADFHARAEIRRRQRLREVPARAIEALGKRRP